MDPKRAERLCAVTGGKGEGAGEICRIDLVASPAMGGVVVGYEMGRQLGVPSIFFERVDGKLVLRRGFAIAKGARVLMVEDIVTTGLSSRECIAGIARRGRQSRSAPPASSTARAARPISACRSWP